MKWTAMKSSEKCRWPGVVQALSCPGQGQMPQSLPTLLNDDEKWRMSTLTGWFWRSASWVSLSQTPGFWVSEREHYLGLYKIMNGTNQIILPTMTKEMRNRGPQRSFVLPIVALRSVMHLLTASGLGSSSIFLGRGNYQHFKPVVSSCSLTFSTEQPQLCPLRERPWQRPPKFTMYTAFGLAISILEVYPTDAHACAK